MVTKFCAINYVGINYVGINCADGIGEQNFVTLVLLDIHTQNFARGIYYYR